MKPIKQLYLMSTIAFFSTLSLSAATWKVFVYMDSSDGLSDMAIKNITDMLRIQAQESMDISIQLHAYDTTGLRYHITPYGLSFVQDVALTGDSKQDFINAMSWGFAQNDADYTMLICWNHGWGILDPE